MKSRVRTEKEKFELLIVGKMLTPEQALVELGYELKTPYENLCTAIKILNEGWYPNWENENEYKYWNWWTMKNGFSYHDVLYHCTSTIVPSALCFKDIETANLAELLLLPLYKKVYE